MSLILNYHFVLIKYDVFEREIFYDVTINDRNSMDITEAEDINKRWQEYTEGLYKKDINEPGNHDGVITHLKADILECEVKCA